VRVERDGLVRRLEKASALVAPGDVIVAPSPRGAKAVRILALPERRGPAPEAAGCYEPAG
jgi:ribosome-associated heat shock protein Hsp15